MRNLRTLEQEGMVNSNNDYQEIINAIAKVGSHFTVKLALVLSTLWARENVLGVFVVFGYSQQVVL